MYGPLTTLLSYLNYTPYKIMVFALYLDPLADTTDQMYKQANILKLDQICIFQTSEFMFKNQCSLLPSIFLTISQPLYPA